MQYSVFIETVGPSHAEPIDQDVLDRFGEALTAYGATVSGAILPEHERTWSVRLKVDAKINDPSDAPVRAAMHAIGVVQVFARTVGLPDWPITNLEVAEWERFCADLERPHRPELAGVAELAALAGVSKQRASILARRSGFPDPVATLAQGDVWDRRQVQEFLAAWTRKPGRPPRDQPPVGDLVQIRMARARAVADPEIGLVVDEGDEVVIRPEQATDESAQQRPPRRR